MQSAEFWGFWTWDKLKTEWEHKTLNPVLDRVWISVFTLLFRSAFVDFAEIRIRSFMATFGESCSKGQQSSEILKWMKRPIRISCTDYFVCFIQVLSLMRHSCTFCLQGFICKLVQKHQQGEHQHMVSASPGCLPLVLSKLSKAMVLPLEWKFSESTKPFHPRGTLKGSH